MGVSKWQAPPEPAAFLLSTVFIRVHCSESASTRMGTPGSDRRGAKSRDANSKRIAEPWLHAKWMFVFFALRWEHKESVLLRKDTFAIDRLRKVITQEVERQSSAPGDRH